MMLNVSRTHVPESWLSTLAGNPSLGYNKEALVALEKSRFSVSTIDSELFPELLSWSTLMNALSTSSCAQSIPSDITKPGDTDTVHEATPTTPSLSLILDPTTLEVGFDQSCFDSLDDLLIRDPFEAFTEVCWLDAVGSPTPSVRAPTPTKSSEPRQVTHPLSEGCDKKPDDCLTCDKEERISMSTIEIDVISCASPESPLPSEPKSPYYTENTSLSSISSFSDEATSFVLFEAPLLAPNRYDSIGHFPMPSSSQHRKVPSRITTFCPNLPAGWTSVR